MLNSISNKYPTLINEPELETISGSIDVDLADTYYIMIDFSDFPETPPIVYETGERIPRKADRHTYSDGALCLTTDAQMDIALKTYAKTHLLFLENIIIPFLQNNSYYEINGQYTYGEYPHGPEVSTIHTYFDILDIKDAKQVFSIIYEKLYEKKRFKPNMLCYCESQKKIKKCRDHLKRYEAFRKIRNQTLINDLRYISEYVKLLKNKNITGGNHLTVESILQKKNS